MLPTLSYTICTAQRSGSNFLCDLLRRTTIAGKPDEFFAQWHISALAGETNPGTPDNESRESVEKYLAEILERGSSTNGVFGVKILGDQVDTILDKLRLVPGIGQSSLEGALRSVMPNLHYIYLVRKDKLAQAVSFSRALQSNLWLEFESYVLETKPSDWTDQQYKQVVERTEKGLNSILTYKYRQIARCLSRIEQQEAYWEKFFSDSGITPLSLTYEQLEQFPERELKRILKYLGLSPLTESGSATVTLKRQRDDLNAEWITRFRQEHIPARQTEQP